MLVCIIRIILSVKYNNRVVFVRVFRRRTGRRTKTNSYNIIAAALVRFRLYNTYYITANNIICVYIIYGTILYALYPTCVVRREMYMEKRIHAQ